MFGRQYAILFIMDAIVVGAMHRVLHIDMTYMTRVIVVIVTMRFDRGKKWCTFFWGGSRNYVQVFQSREFNSRNNR
jgi:hypothetical protein